MLLGLLGGTRVHHMRGHGVLTFHLPFIIAATALGGPVAGGWVAFVATFEMRELREIRWYGDAVQPRRPGVLGRRSQASSSMWSSTACSAASPIRSRRPSGRDHRRDLRALQSCRRRIAAGVVMLRDGLTAARDARACTTCRIGRPRRPRSILGWVLVFAYSGIGWWAALIAAGLCVVIWQGYDYRELARHDAMTGLLSRAGFDARLEEVLVGVRRGAGKAALLAIDLDGFKAINEAYGHATGDDVIREVGVAAPRRRSG